jgi:hypothetical protein
LITECTQRRIDFQPLAGRDVVAQFDGGSITSDGGGLLLRETERVTGIIRRFAGCFTDHRKPERIEHTVEELVGQRVYGLALGYEDLNDHDALRHDPLIGVLAGKADPEGQTRRRARDRGKGCAGKSTLNRLELTPVRASAKSRYKKIAADRRAVEDLFVQVFLESFGQAPERIVLDLDATDDPLHGNQSGRFFHGYYRSYCYLPLYIFCGEHLLCARLRPSDIDESAGSVKELKRIVGMIRSAWPTTQIVVRADSSFCRESLMAWCEQHGVDYVLGLARNSRLEAELAESLEQAKRQFASTGQAARVFKDFLYRTLESWSRSRRVVGKAEYLPKGANPRFVVTSLSPTRWPAQTLYEQEYCGRGEMENRIKEQQLWLFADRTSASTMRANQLRLWLSSVAYTLMLALRRVGLKGTELARAQCGTIRTKLLKIGALVRVTVRKVWVSLSESFPYVSVFRRVYAHLRSQCPVRLRC